MRLTVFQSLKYRNYRLFFTGQVISVIGTWLQMTAMPWLVYRMTGSALLLGTIGFLSQIFILLFSPIAGTLADHFNKKRLIMLTQALSMLQALLLAVLTLTGTVQIWHILFLATGLSIVNAFDMPARQSFVIQMVEREHLINAIGLNSMVFNTARLIGPAIAGLLIAAFGEGMCFLLNGLSFLAVLVALYFIRPLGDGVGMPEEKVTVTEKFLSGIAYIRSAPNIASILLLLAITGLTGTFPAILMPIFVKDIYHMGASGLGMFMSAMGIGALFGTIRIAATRSITGVEKTIFAAAVLLGALIIAFGFAKSIPLALVLLAVIGYAVVLQMGLTNTLIQLTTPDELRGRVMGFYVMAFMGFAPLGSLTAGAMAHRFGAPVTVAFGGAITLIAAALLRKRIFHA